MKNKKLAVGFLLIFCCIQLFLILFFRRGIFLKPYDEGYWKDRYEHSQYQLPISQRIIGDDGLYAYSGYRLIEGDDPFSINVDKPPAGKYLIGLSILIFDNPAFSGLIFGLGSVVLFFFIAKRLLKHTVTALFVSLLLLLDPMIASQFWISTYDIIQLFFLLLNILLLMQLGKQSEKKSRNINLLIVFIAGISLGIFAEVKPPFILPFLLALEVIYLIRQYSLSLSISLVAGLTLGVFIPYFRYVQLHSLLDFIRVHKFMANFYLQSRLRVHHSAIWQVIFLGKFPHITSGQPLTVSEWWLMWPVAISGSFLSLWLFFKKKLDFFWKLSIFIIMFSLAFYIFIPTYPRYLILILPFAYLVLARIFINLGIKTKKLLSVLVILYGLTNSIFFLPPPVTDSLDVFYYSLSKGYFQDIYKENITNGDSLKMTQEEFRFTALTALRQAEVESMEIQELDKTATRWKKECEVNLLITYRTRNLGKFIEEKTVKLEKLNGQWKVVWDWDILLDSFLPGYSIATNILPGKRGRIVDDKGLILVEDALGSLISVNPDRMHSEKEQEMLEAIYSVSFQSHITLQNAYLENALPNSFVPLATNFIPLTRDKKQLLESFPEVKLEPYYTRLYYSLDPLSVTNTAYKECCTRIYSATNYRGEKGLEKEYDQPLSGQNGGETVLLNEKGERVRTIIRLQKKDGQNITRW